MQKSFRLVLLTTAIAVAGWWAQPQAGGALENCRSLPSSCPIGATTTCVDDEFVYPCECVSIRGNGRWLCFGWFP